MMATTAMLASRYRDRMNSNLSNSVSGAFAPTCRGAAFVCSIVVNVCAFLISTSFSTTS
jgi:hypothetical protein